MIEAKAEPQKLNPSQQCDAGDCPSCTKRCLARPGRYLDPERRLPKYPYPHPVDLNY